MEIWFSSKLYHEYKPNELYKIEYISSKNKKI